MALKLKGKPCKRQAYAPHKKESSSVLSSQDSALVQATACGAR